MNLKQFFYLLIASYLFIFCEYKLQPPLAEFKFNFEIDQELNLINWKCHTLFSLSDSVALAGEKSLKVSFFPSDEEAYPGFSMGAFKKDWHKMDTLILNVFNPVEDSVKLVIRIDDSDNPTYADRYNQRFLLAGGWTDIRLPLNTLTTSGTGRVLSSKDIQSLILFFAQLQKKRTLYFDQFYIGRYNEN